jgi:hypothetical protein
MVTGETEHQQVVLGVIAAAKDAVTVMNVELPLGARDAADLAAAAARCDETAASRGRELGRARTPIVGVAHSLSEREPDE